jgi:eukaryotic-like serine/threonine-protein kinase
MNATAILADLEGCIVDSRFSLLRWLGGTADGSVYLTEIKGAEKAAIKLVPAASPGADARLAGWKAAASIDHPHLLRVYHAGRTKLEDGPDDEVVYAVTECADEVLAEILPDRALSPEETADMLEPILDALACLHGHGFVHGRLKPANILVVADSLKLSPDCSPIASGKAAAPALQIGACDAPELSRGVVSPAADVWSLGMVLVAALTQRTPAWDRESGFEPVVRPALAAPFEAIVRDCLRLDAASRLTLPEVRDRLEGKELAEGAPPALDPDFTPTPTHSTRWAPAWIASAVFLGIAVTALILHSRQSPPSAPAAEQASAPAADQPIPAPPSVPATARAEVRPRAASVPSPVAQKPRAARSALPSAPQTAGDAPAPAEGAILRRVMPHAPPEALATIRGTVRIDVRVQVDASGAVSDAVSQSPDASRYFNRIAVEAAQAWQFAPAAPSAWVLHFDFRRNGATAKAEKQMP